MASCVLMPSSWSARVFIPIRGIHFGRDDSSYCCTHQSTTLCYGCLRFKQRRQLSSTPIRPPSTPTHTRSLCNEMDGYSFLGQYSHYPLSGGRAALRAREVLSQLVPTSVAEKEEERPRSATQRPAKFVHSWIRFCNLVAAAAAGVVATLQFVVDHIKCLYYKSLSSLSRATREKK